MKQLPEKELLRPDEVAEYFSLHVKTIYRWIAEKRIDAVKIGPFKVLRIRRNSVEIMTHPLEQ